MTQPQPTKCSKIKEPYQWRVQFDRREMDTYLSNTDDDFLPVNNGEGVLIAMFPLSKLRKAWQ